MISLNNLPLIIELNDFGGNYASYIDAVYEIFHNDFIKHKAHFGSHELKMKFNPIFQDRAYTFYHMTHEGEVESERLPDLRRCERIGWAKPSVENVEIWNLRFWRQSRKNSENRVCILLDVEGDYDEGSAVELIVLESNIKHTIKLWNCHNGYYAHEYFIYDSSGEFNKRGLI